MKRIISGALETISIGDIPHVSRVFAYKNGTPIGIVSLHNNKYCLCVGTTTWAFCSDSVQGCVQSCIDVGYDMFLADPFYQ